MLLLITTALLIFQSSNAAPKSSLRLVNLVYRHGDRSPAKTYPKNPHKVNETWPQGLGWLTKKGMEEEYALGQYLRRRYDGFLSKNYVNYEIYVDSSDEDRCLMSAYSNLAGLYPPGKDQMWHANLSWQPIPVHTRPESEDNMINLGEYCARYQQLYNESLKSDPVKREEKENKDFYKFIAEKTGVTFESIDTIWEIADTLFCEKQHNVSWPDWVNETVYEKLRRLDAWSFDLMFQGREESRLKGGPLLGEWLDLVKEKMANQSLENKLNMYSGHDTTVAALLSALQVFNKESPPYTATVFMELHENTPGNFHIELYFRNVTTTDPSDDTPPYNITIPGCDFECPVSKFLSLTKDAIPVDWQAECSIGENQLELNTATIIAVSVGSGIILILVVMVVILCCKRRRHQGSIPYHLTI